jgi:hypothetical protein
MIIFYRYMKVIRERYHQEAQPLDQDNHLPS